MSGSSRSLDRFATTFDHEGLVANAGLILAGTLMARLGLLGLIERWVRTGSANPGPKICTVVAAMLAGGTHIDHVEMLRAGRTGRVLGFAPMAPSTVGSFLRTFTFGHVRQLEAVASRTLARAWALGAGPGKAPFVVDLDSCVASDFARRDPGSFRPHLRWLLALIMEAVNDDIDTAEAEADADSRAEVRLVAADADGADLPGRRGSRGWGGPVGDHPAASSCPRWSDRGAAGVEAGPAASVSPGGVGGRGVAGRGRPAPGDGGRAGRRVGGAAGKIARWG